MKRKIHYVDSIISPHQIEFVGSDERLSDYEEYSRELALREIGLEYARKYAKLEIAYVYDNMRENQHDHYDELQDLEKKPYLKFLFKRFRYSLI